MKRFLITAAALLLSSCASNVWDTAATGMCIASEASCVKSCQRDYQDGYLGAGGYDYCASSCTSGGNGCAFTAN